MILVSPPVVPAPNEGFTVMVWAKSDNTLQNQFGTLFANGLNAPNHFQLDADGVGNWRLRDTSNINTVIGPIVDEWTHLAITYDGDKMAEATDKFLASRQG